MVSGYCDENFYLDHPWELRNIVFFKGFIFWSPNMIQQVFFNIINNELF